jgi:hypothetical protein
MPYGLAYLQSGDQLSNAVQSCSVDHHSAKSFIVGDTAIIGYTLLTHGANLRKTRRERSLVSQPPTPMDKPWPVMRSN